MMETQTSKVKYWFMFSVFCLFFHTIFIYSNASKVAFWSFLTVQIAPFLLMLGNSLRTFLSGNRKLLPSFLQLFFSPIALWVWYFLGLGVIAFIINDSTDEDEKEMEGFYDFWNKYSAIFHTVIAIILVISFIILKRDKFTYHLRSSTHPFYNKYILITENFIIPFYALGLFIYIGALTYYHLLEDSNVEKELTNNSYSSSFMIIFNIIILLYMTGFGEDQGHKLINKLWETKTMNYRPVL